MLDCPFSTVWFDRMPMLFAKWTPNRKIVRDLVAYGVGVDDFAPSTGDPRLYPLDLEFTLAACEFYYPTFDDNGIPVRHYQSVGRQYNPTRIAAYALACFNHFITTSDEGFRTKFLAMADWFLAVESGRYEYHFDWGVLRAPWISCMAQGEAASVLIRAFQLTGKECYLEHAVRSVEPFLVDVSSGGVQSTIGADGVFLEEYPGSANRHVLNGFLYALVGLLELNDIRADDQLLDIQRKLLESLTVNLKRWDAGLWSYYQIDDGRRFKNCCTPSYHNLHITQLGFVQSKFPDAIIASTIKRWQKGRARFDVRLRALVNKSIYRLANRAQR